jgi:hypothetical protein
MFCLNNGETKGSRVMVFHETIGNVKKFAEFTKVFSRQPWKYG